MLDAGELVLGRPHNVVNYEKSMDQSVTKVKAKAK